ncbi:RNA-dependent DNA polymerase, partial [Listeria monocytogenes]|nr:RNA-dependent DNA polymerase [Listeria monocytogenes]EAD4304071.1 RNA-dependent DNA polymerase [Listeria monocytogenes]EAD7054115.1 RNA-dependent DNA polymerase [Listeria monocytogenes]EAD8574866.1 RNA-dependent DNA polymerase [Listeria monocytogenes]EAE2112668.1 RNA-dependent DNA polymerase [Listeria monocytogenes]
HGNFISYAKRAQKKFDEISPNTNNLIMNQLKNRKKKIEKMLGYKIHTKI